MRVFLKQINHINQLMCLFLCRLFKGRLPKQMFELLREKKCFEMSE